MVPPERAGRGPLVALAIVAAVLALCGVGTSLLVVPVIRARRVTVSAPATLPGGLHRVPADPGGAVNATSIRSGLYLAVGARTAITAYYTDGKTADPPMLLAAGTRASLSYGGELTLTLNEVKIDSAVNLTGFRAYPSGALGGAVRCSSGTTYQGARSPTPITLCGWADRGSFGVFVSNTADSAVAAADFLRIRAAVES